MLEVGETFERFRIEAILGQGGMGRVYRAFDSRLERHVALKVLVLDPASDGAARGEAVARMLREARVAAALEHPNKVSVFDLGELGDLPYIAMEYIAGKTLRAYAGQTPPSWQSKLSWLLAAASALDAADAAGIVHRDVKPENVMVRDDGVVKVLDFGIARRVLTLDVATGAPHASFDGRLVGTPAYMAPEQLTGGALDGRVDQFAWGVTAYELLTGALPWDVSHGPVGTMASILNATPTSLRARLADLPRAVDEAILRTLSKAPTDRFSRLGDVIEALEHFASSTRRSAIGRGRGLSSSGAFPVAAQAAKSSPSSPLDKPASPSERGSGAPPAPLLAGHSASVDVRSADHARDGTRISSPLIPQRVTGTRIITSLAPLSFVVDVEQRFAKFPPDFTVKGMFFTRLLGLGARFVEPVKPKLLGPPRGGRYLPFNDYPQVDYSRMCHAVAVGLHPTLAIPEAMRRLARQDFNTFAASAIGRVSLALMGDVKHAILGMPATYDAVMKGGTVTAKMIATDEFELVFREFYGWVDCYPIGNIEGIADRYHRSCVIEADVESAVNAVYRIRLLA